MNGMSTDIKVRASKEKVWLLIANNLFEGFGVNFEF